MLIEGYPAALVWLLFEVPVALHILMMLIKQLLNDYFCSTCTKDNGALPPFHSRVPVGVEFDNVTFTPENVFRVMQKLKNSKSSGPDGIPSNLFKKLAAHLALPLSILFNNSVHLENSS